MGFIDEILQIIRSATSNNIKELRIRQLVGKEHGHWIVDVLAPWETVKHICERLNISASKFRRRWRRRPSGAGKAEVGATGRVIHIQSDPQLDKFLQGASRLGAITPEQIIGVTIEIASHKVKTIDAATPTKVKKKLANLSKANGKRS